MQKPILTPDQVANIIEARDVMWPMVDPRLVEANLTDWTSDGWRDVLELFEPTGPRASCGTPACFGGWCERYIPFRERARLTHTTSSTLKSWDALLSLFVPLDFIEQTSSEWDVFNPRGCFHGDEEFEGSDHELVTNRLNWLLENSDRA